MTQNQANDLVQALQTEFMGQVESESINGQGRYRFAVTSARFAGIPHLQRQDAIWQVVDRTLPRDATLDISIILAFAPAELAPAGN